MSMIETTGSTLLRPEDALVEAVGLDAPRTNDVKPYEPSPTEKALVDALEIQLEESKDRRKAHIAKFKATRAAVVGPHHQESAFTLGEAERKETKLPDSDPVNMQRQLYGDLMARLFPFETRITCTPKRGDVDKVQCIMRAAITQHYYDECKVSQQLRLAGGDMLLCAEGVVLVAPVDADFVELSAGVGFDPGELCAARIDPEDFDCDPSSTHPENDRWRCVRFHVPLAHLRRHGNIDPNVLDNLPTKKRFATLDPDDTASDVDIARDVGDQDFVELRRWYFYGGTQTMTCTTATGFPGLVRPLQEYNGPREGPLAVLGVQNVGGLRYGMCPLTDIEDLSKATDQLVVKMTNQALKAGSRLIAGAEDEEDLKNFAAAADLAVIKMANPGSARVEKIDPLIPSLLPAVEFLQTQQSQASTQTARSVGNNGIAKTAREAMIMREQGMVRTGDLSGQVKAWRKSVLMVFSCFVDGVIRQLLANDAATGQETQFLTPGNQQMAMKVTAKDAEYTREHFEFELIDDAMQFADPSMRVEQMLGILTNLAAAILPWMQMGIDPTPVIRRVARESGVAELEDMFGQNDNALATAMAQMAVQAQYRSVGERSAPEQPMGAGGGVMGGQMAGPMTPAGGVPPRI